MKRALLAIVLVSALSLSASADEKTDAKMAEDQMVLLEKLGDLLSADKSDCDKMAVDLNRYVADNKERLSAIKAWSKGLGPEQKKALEEKYKARTETAVKKIHAGLNSCAKSKSVQDALKRL
jgi:hypothetical protein